MKRTISIIFLLYISCSLHASEPSAYEGQFRAADVQKELQEQRKLLQEMLQLHRKVTELMCDVVVEVQFLKCTAHETPQSVSSFNAHHPYLQMGIAAFYYFIIIPLSKKWAKKQSKPALKMIGNLIALDHATLGTPITKSLSAIKYFFRSIKKSPLSQ